MQPSPIELEVGKHPGLAEWFVSGRRGLSSEFIVECVLGLPNGMLRGRFAQRKMEDWPLDLSDFGRCFDLLEEVPSLKASFSLLGQSHPIWGNLVANWDQLADGYREFLAREGEGYLPSANWQKVFQLCLSCPSQMIFCRHLIYQDTSSFGRYLNYTGPSEGGTPANFRLFKVLGDGQDLHFCAPVLHSSGFVQIMEASEAVNLVPIAYQYQEKFTTPSEWRIVK